MGTLDFNITKSLKHLHFTSIKLTVYLNTIRILKLRNLLFINNPKIQLLEPYCTGLTDHRGLQTTSNCYVIKLIKPSMSTYACYLKWSLPARGQEKRDYGVQYAGLVSLYLRTHST